MTKSTLPYDIYLASKSPRRRALLEQIGVRYCLIDVDVPEIQEPKESSSDYVVRLAQTKAKAGWDINKDKPALGADTIVVLRDKVLEKPESEASALAMLQALSGKTHQVMTAVSLYTENKSRVVLNTTDVTFRPIDRNEIVRYWQRGEPKDKAGAYGIQGLGGIFVKEIKGSYSSVVGLPVFETAALLQEFGIAVWHSSTP
jgi:septum formation protein